MWSGDTLRLPSILWEAYRHVLVNHELLGACEVGTTEKGIHGGAGAAETLAHFTYRFANSVSRLCYLVLDPRQEAAEISSDIRVSFSTDKVHLLDLAGGTGAAASGLLATLSHDRSVGKLPKLPLTVSIMAADLSRDALQLYQEVVTELRPRLAEQGITVTLQTVSWDATDARQTSRLCDQWLSESGEKELFIVVSNLSGVGKTLLKQFERSFQHVTERVADRTSTFIWIEPPGSGAAEFMKRVKQTIFDAATWLIGRVGSKVLHLKYTWVHEIQRDRNLIEGGLQVMDYKRLGQVEAD